MQPDLGGPAEIEESKKLYEKLKECGQEAKRSMGRGDIVQQILELQSDQLEEFKELQSVL